LIAMATLLLTASMTPVPAASPAVTPLEALDSVFVVSTVQSQGAAFLITERLLITAAHVVEGSSTVRLEGTQDPPVQEIASVIYVDSSSDVAVLRTDNTLEQAPLIFSEEAVIVGDEVFAAGSPIDGVVLSRGTVSAIDIVDGIVASTPVDSGNSGGPLLDSTGSVVGMVYARSVPSGDAFAVPVGTLQLAIIQAESQPAPGPSDRDQALPMSSSTAMFPAIAALVIALAALSIAIIALVLAVANRRRRAAPPITITLNEE
jgi:S1-C subfamily serine protease